LRSASFLLYHQVIIFFVALGRKQTKTIALNKLGNH